MFKLSKEILAEINLKVADIKVENIQLQMSGECTSCTARCKFSCASAFGTN